MSPPSARPSFLSTVCSSRAEMKPPSSSSTTLNASFRSDSADAASASAPAAAAARSPKKASPSVRWRDSKSSYSRLPRPGLAKAETVERISSESASRPRRESAWLSSSAVISPSPLRSKRSYKFLQIKRNADGSLTRPTFVPISPPSDSDDSAAAVLSRDVPLDPSRRTWLRLFLPTDPPAPRLLPVLVYFHGGGFILFSAASAPFHDRCCRLACELPALVVSVEYRLAPEHRLPAAYDDAVDAVRWLRRRADPAEAADPWLRGRADFSRCFLAGSSSGGNIAYHAARRLLVEEPEDLRPLVLRGLVLNQPYFGGDERTPSEAASAGAKIISLAANDLMWELCLPEGADRDHVFCNPMIHHRRRRRGTGTDSTGPPALLPRCLVRGYLGDPLIDRQREFAAMLEEQAVGAVALLDREGYHAVELFDGAKADLFIADVKKFLSDSSPPPPPPATRGADGVVATCKY